MSCRSLCILQTLRNSFQEEHLAPFTTAPYIKLLLKIELKYMCLPIGKAVWGKMKISYLLK